jgi:uncharacterized membrane protein
MVSNDLGSLDRAIELALSVGVLMSGACLILGLWLGSTPVLRWGLVLLLATPMARVVVVTCGLFQRRDWLFASISLWIFLVLASAASVGLHLRP